jgi:hypothetical protein
VYKGYSSRRMMRGLLTSGRGSMLPVTRAKWVEALKPVPYVGTFWDGQSQWRNRLPHEG